MLVDESFQVAQSARREGSNEPRHCTKRTAGTGVSRSGPQLLGVVLQSFNGDTPPGGDIASPGLFPAISGALRSWRAPPRFDEREKTGPMHCRPWSSEQTSSCASQEQQ